ncbi:MAG: sodium/panthothenate symporter, partial [Synergistes sp.]|nr:sodium/panthothenate symporter [Synergistes sp.]
MMLLPLAVYFALLLFIAYIGSRSAVKQSDTMGFMEEYFLGGRSMHGLVLAMTIVASYTSASSFVGGP